MKKNILYALVTVLALYSCSEKNIVESNGEEQEYIVSNIQATIQGFEPGNKGELRFGDSNDEAKVMTRTALQLEGKTLKFYWKEGDNLSLFSNMANDNSLQIYAINHQDVNKPSASFSSETFQMNSRFNYYAFSPGTYLKPDTRKDQLTLRYDRQRQTANNNTDHLGAYNYMASYEKPNTQATAAFDFKNLSEPMRIRIYLPNGGKFTKFEIMRRDGDSIPYYRMLDLTQGGNVGENYAPRTYTETRGEGHRSYELQLGEVGGDGILINHTNTPDNLLRLWMMFPVTDELKGVPLVGKLTGKVYNNETSAWEDKIYYIDMTGYEFDGGTYGSFDKVPKESTTLSINVQVNKLWQVGNTQTRAVGDPGYDKDDLKKPQYLYLYVCKNGKFRGIWQREIVPEEWQESGDIWKYQTTIDLVKWGFDLGDDDLDNYHVYAVASYHQLFVTTDMPTDGADDSENVIKGVTYEFPTGEMNLTTAFGTSDVTDNHKESYFKNIYVNDYKMTAAEYDEMPIMLITLYHACAKVDVQWNNTTSTALTGNVSVDGVPTSGLKLFQPTANTGSANPWSPSTTITDGTCWNGRAVFYVPQMENQQYSITTGTGHTQNVTFTAPINVKLTGSDYGKTAWLKANITVE